MVLGGSTVDELFIALCCASINSCSRSRNMLAQSAKYAWHNYEKTACNLLFYICKHGDGITIFPDLKCMQERTTGFKIGQGVGTIPQV